MQGKFTEQDEKSYVDALNFIATQAKFSDGPVDVKYGIELYKHFAFLQSIIGKISANIAEPPKVYDPKVEAKEDNKSKKSTSKKS